MAEPTDELAEQRDRLRADCGNCFGLCCVALRFVRSSEFAIDKPAGQPCPNLLADFGCGIHADLRTKGFSGCTVFDCFGAGQQVSQATFGGADWRQAPESAATMYQVFDKMRQLHELIWYLTDALGRSQARPLHAELRLALDRTARLTQGTPDDLRALDVDAVRERVKGLLQQTSERVRNRIPGRKRNYRGADLAGANLRGTDLRGANLRQSCLIAANLRDADLSSTDVLAADFRDADLRGADLTDALYLTQTQLNAAKGDPTTTLPPTLNRPDHW